MGHGLRLSLLLRKFAFECQERKAAPSLLLLGRVFFASIDSFGQVLKQVVQLSIALLYEGQKMLGLGGLRHGHGVEA